MFLRLHDLKPHEHHTSCRPRMEAEQLSKFRFFWFILQGRNTMKIEKGSGFFSCTEKALVKVL